MTQTRRLSLVETLTNTVIGYGISVVLTATILPMHGLHPSGGQAALISLWFTGASIARGYIIRRWFNSHIHRLASWITRSIS